MKINCKGKRTVEKANKGINVEIIIIGLKIKIKKREREKKDNSKELQKPNVEAEVYNNNKKCDWGKKKKKLKSLIGFLSANEINNYNRVGGKGKEKVI